VATATSAAAGHVLIVQDLKHLLRPCPSLDVDLLARDTDLSQFVEHAKMFFRGHFAAASGLIAHGQVVVAVLAVERAAPRYLNGNLQRHPLRTLPMMQVRAEFVIP
jgi:hypothetical protein